MTLLALADGLAAHPSILGKPDIARATRGLLLTGDGTGQPGDDAAVLPRSTCAGRGGRGFAIGLDAVPMPAGADPARWLRAVPNLAFLLSVTPDAAAAACTRFAAGDIAAAGIGHATDGSTIELRRGGERAQFWGWRVMTDPGLHAAPPEVTSS